MFFRRHSYHGNPLYTAERRKFFSRRFFFDCFLFVVVIGAWVVFVSSTPYFHVQVSEYPDLLFIPKEQARSSIENLLNRRILGLIPRRTFWFLRTDALTHELENAYPFAQFVVRKEYPDRVSIALREPLQLIDLAVGGGKEFYLDRRGIAVYQVPAPLEVTFIATPDRVAGANVQRAASVISAGALKSRSILFPLVVYTSEVTPTIGEEVLTPALVSLANDLYTSIARHGGVVVSYIDFTTRPDHIDVVTEEGWRILWNEHDDLSSQMTRLATVLREKVRERRPKLEYIDLRFGDRLYLKYR